LLSKHIRSERERDSDKRESGGVVKGARQKAFPALKVPELKAVGSEEGKGLGYVNVI
jgi:hypothetical protein